MIRTVLAAAVAVALAACGSAPADSVEANVQRTNVEYPEIDLDGQGLGLQLRFGEARAKVLKAATSQFGPPTATHRIEECGEGPIDSVRLGGLSLNFQDDRLVGWFVRSPFRHKIASGLGVGDPRSALGATRVAESTLGEEFRTASGVSGLLDSKGQVIESLWSGSACLFR